MSNESAQPTTPAPVLNEAGEVDDAREYYCPACGQRYDTAGICTGTDEGPHEKTPVEKVANADKSDDEESRGIFGR